MLPWQIKKYPRHGVLRFVSMRPIVPQRRENAHHKFRVQCVTAAKACCIMARSQCRSFFGAKRCVISAGFQFQQLHFSVDPSGVPCQTAACADNAVAGNDDRYFVMSDGAADGLRGHPRKDPPSRPAAARSRRRSWSARRGICRSIVHTAWRNAEPMGCSGGRKSGSLPVKYTSSQRLASARACVSCSMRFPADRGQSTFDRQTTVPRRPISSAASRMRLPEKS